MSYEIKLAAFEGPLDLLLHLIAKNKIDIYDIPMAQLTQQYMDYIEESKEFNVEVATEFLVMAAKLIQIKSRIILPSTKSNEEVTDAETQADPREELVQRLLEYQRFQKLSKILLSMFESEEKFIKRSPMKLSKKALPPQNLSIKQLVKTFISVITTDEELAIPEILVSSEVFNVKDKMTVISSKLDNLGELKLSEVIDTNSSSEIVAAFLALLELIKRHKATAEQLIPFAEILITTTEDKPVADIEDREQVSDVD